MVCKFFCREHIVGFSIIFPKRLSPADILRQKQYHHTGEDAYSVISTIELVTYRVFAKFLTAMAFKKDTGACNNI